MATSLGMARTPQARGFTIAEKRSLRFEQIALYAVFLVAVIAAVISFVALSWVGEHLGLGWASPLIPLAIDGFAIACSVGIVRSQASGEPARERASEWVGLLVALALSITGNVEHVLATGSGELSPAIKIPFASAIPVLLAYGIHVYGRALTRGISARVMADDPGQVRLDLAPLHTSTTAHEPPGAPRAAQRVQTRPAGPVEPATGRTAPQEATPATAAPERVQVGAGSEKDRMRALFDAAISADPHTKPDAAALHREAGATKDPATTRRWVQAWWSEHDEREQRRGVVLVEATG